MKTLQLNDSFIVEIPDGWKSEADGNLITLYSEDNGIGALQLSSYQAPDASSIDLTKELEDYLDDKYKNINVELFNGYSYFSITDEDDVYWRYWLSKKSNDVMFISYNCESVDRGKEDAIVNVIIESVMR